VNIKLFKNPFNAYASNVTLMFIFQTCFALIYASQITNFVLNHFTAHLKTVIDNKRDKM